MPVLTAAMDATWVVYLGHVLDYPLDMIRKTMNSELINGTEVLWNSTNT